MASNIASSSRQLSTPPSSPPDLFDPPDGVQITEALELKRRHAGDRRPMLNQYQSITEVGRGVHGEVYMCYDIAKKRHVAIKAVKRSGKEDKTLRKPKMLPATPHTPYTDRIGHTEQKIRKEIAIMKKCRHGNVVRLLEVIDDRLRARIFMVMEYLGGGEVKWRNSNQEPVQTVDQSRRIIRDAILGLEYLHHQGIIHRDIKPANLLWTSDRSSVKISDFGVSHFSYAQRLAAAGKGDIDSYDTVLFDDSDLSKTAGTPSFLAPEIVWDASTDISPAPSTSNTTSISLPTARHTTHARSSSTLHASSQHTSHRPPITKAIDVWALGITLYCLLFGRPTFQSLEESLTEYQLYNLIRTSDWNVPETMGYDRVPTGGRHPPASNCVGSVVLDLLDRFLQKDPNNRITLAQVKRHGWFTRDLPDPDKWIRDTSPRKDDRVTVSDSDTRSAMSSVQFSWNWHRRLTHQISTLLLRTVRPKPPQPTLRPVVGRPDRSAPEPSRNASISRNKSATATMGRDGGLFGVASGSGSRRDKGKKRADTHPAKVSVPLYSARSKSFERWPLTSSPISSPATGRRGSDTLLSPPTSRSQFGYSPQPSPTASQVDEKSRSRFLASLLNLGFNRFSHGTSASASASPTTSSPVAATTSPASYTEQRGTPSDIMSRRSEEALRSYRMGAPLSGGTLTAAKRASSWANNPADYNEEVTSLNSDYHDVDHETMLLGAGGVCNDQSTLGVNPFSDSRASMEASGSGGNTNVAIAQPSNQQRSERFYVGSASSSTHGRLAATSPLTQVAYESEDDEGEDTEQAAFDFDDYSSSFGESLYEEVPQVVEGLLDDDEESDEEETAPLEVRRRNPASPQR